MAKFKIGDDVWYGKIPAVVGAIIDNGKKYRILYTKSGNERQSHAVDVAPEQLTKIE